MKKTAKPLRIFLLILSLGFSTNGFSQSDSVKITASQLKSVILVLDSLDECKEITDSLQSRVQSALQVIQTSDTVINNLWVVVSNKDKIISNNQILMKDEKQVSAAYRKKYRLWKVLAIMLGGLNVYQMVK